MNAIIRHASGRPLKPILLALALLLPASAQAQGLYLPSGTRGVGISGAFSGSKAGTGPALSLGYATEQRLGLGLTAAYLSNGDGTPGESALLVAPIVSFFGARQTDGDLLNVQTALTLEWLRLNDLDGSWDSDGRSLGSLSCGVVLSRNLNAHADPSHQVVPQLSALLTAIHFAEDVLGDPPLIPDEPVITVGFGIGFGFPLGKGRVLTFEPGVAYNRAGVAGSVGLGVVIPTEAE